MFGWKENERKGKKGMDEKKCSLFGWIEIEKRKENGGNGLPWGLPFFPSKLEGNKKEERVVHGVRSISFPSFYLVKQTKENYSPFPFLSLPNIDNNFNFGGL